VPQAGYLQISMQFTWTTGWQQWKQCKMWQTERDCTTEDPITILHFP